VFPLGLATKFEAWQVPSLAATPPPMVLGKSGEMAINAYIKGEREQGRESNSRP